MEWFRLRNTLNCFDWWYMKYECLHGGWVQLRFQSCFRFGISSSRNRVGSRFWVASRSSFAFESPEVDSLQIGLGTSFLSRGQLLSASYEKDCPFFEVRITSLALMRKIIASVCISVGDYSLSQGSVNALNSLALLSLKQWRCDQAMTPINRTLEVLRRELICSWYLLVVQKNILRSLK